MKSPAASLWRRSVDAKVYPRKAVLAACVRFADRASFSIARTPRGGLRVTARRREGTDDASWRELSAVFEDELIHHALRLEAVAAGGRMRELIVLRALASAEGAAGADAAASVEARLDGQVDALLEQARSASGPDPLGIMEEWRPASDQHDGDHEG